MSPRDLAQCYLYDAYNDAEHADRLVQIARHEFNENDNVDRALDALRSALDPAERSAMRIRDAIEKLEALSAKEAK